MRIHRVVRRVPRVVQVLGLVALVATAYIAVANLKPEPEANAAARAAGTTSRTASGPVPGVRQIRAGNSGLCLTVSSTTKKGANGAKIQQRSCDPRKKTQRFEIVPLQDEGNAWTYAIRPQWKAGWCLATNGGEKNGVTIVQRKCDYGYRQMFFVNCAAPGDRCYIATRKGFNGKCLNIHGNSRKQGANVALYDCRYKNQTNMQFTIA
ncbi:RICIN domain-containing protein [Micromonospora sp. NPDC049523]|uniref:RICIN domain-containing protein n=1 Tax=Micromonospora sp. NPDC049523 TaxID=3155921 RepID=UPI00341CBA36